VEGNTKPTYKKKKKRGVFPKVRGGKINFQEVNLITIIKKIVAPTKTKRVYKFYFFSGRAFLGKRARPL